MRKIVDLSSVRNRPIGGTREWAIGKSNSGITKFLYFSLVSLLASQPLHGLSIVYPRPEVTMSQAESVLVGHLSKADGIWKLRVIRVLKGPYSPGDVLTVYPSIAYPPRRNYGRAPLLVDDSDVVFSAFRDHDTGMLFPACPYGAVLPHDVTPEQLPAVNFLDVVRFAENTLGIAPATNDVPPEWAAPIPAWPGVAQLSGLVATSSVSGPSPSWREPPSDLLPSLQAWLYGLPRPPASQAEDPAGDTDRRDEPDWIGGFMEGAVSGGTWGLIPAIGILLWMRNSARRNLPSPSSAT